MNISIELLRRYPWLPSLETYYSDIANKDPIEFINDVFSKPFINDIERRIIGIFSYAFDRLEQIQDYRDDEYNIYIYVIIKILLYVLDNKIITNRIANLYSKQTYDELLQERGDENIFDICSDLTLNFEYSTTPYQYGVNYTKDQIEVLKSHFKIHFIDYLGLAANLRDDYRKLVHNPLQSGYVFIDKKDLARLLQEYVRKKLIVADNEPGKNSERYKNKLLENTRFKALHDKIHLIWEEKKEEFEYSFDYKFDERIDISESFPPCAKEILRKIEEGQNIIHIERLFLVFFLHALNFPRENIIELFKRLPDFDSKIAEYQIDFAKKKEYSPHSCQTLKSLTLCMAQKYKDEICLEGYFSKKLDAKRPLSHPLFYVQLKQYRKSNQQKEQHKSPLPKHE